MRDNFRPNVRIVTNILMVIGTFLIAFNLASIGKEDREFIQRRDDCADATWRVTSQKNLLKNIKSEKFII